MPLGGGAGDIVNGLKLCKWIYDNHFIKSRTAGQSACDSTALVPIRFAANHPLLLPDKRYIDFLNDVRSLQSVLESLKYADPEFVDPVYQDIAGDFHKTLKTCKEFLEKHKKLEKEPARLPTNVIWGLYTKDDVDSLCDKLQFHVRTLNLLVAAQTRQDVSELVERSRPGAQSAEPLQDPVPAWLRREFQERIAMAAPFTFKTLDDIPLGKGCSALLRHFDRLSDESGKKETGSQLALEYLGLLKCHWLIEVLRNGKGFKSRPVGSPARRLISDLHEKVNQRLLSRTLHALLPATDDELWSLENDNQAFHIWEIPKEEFKISPWEAEKGEEKILTVLLTKGEKLVFIRTDTTGMRIVPIMETPNGRRRSDNHGEIRLNMDIDKFIPRYTVTKPGDKLVAEIHQKGFPVVKYELHNMEVACQVQRAITGYQVSRDESNVDWSIQWPWTRLSGEENMSGRAHIWEWNPLTKDSAVEVPTASIYTPSIAGSQISVLLRQTELPNGQGKHRQLQPPVPPALVLFSQDGPKPTYVHLDCKSLSLSPVSTHTHLPTQC